MCGRVIGHGGADMKIEILYFDGCPTYLETEKALQKVLVREDAGGESS